MRLQLSGVSNVFCLSHENTQSNGRKYHGITNATYILQVYIASVLEHKWSQQNTEEIKICTNLHTYIDTYI